MAKLPLEPVQVSAAQLLDLLAVRHSGDVFVPECKDGPSQYNTHARMDAWVMPRSWSKPETTGYEIKVARSDFLRDDKWPAYLPLCHRFYFVAPPGVIQLDEVPAEAGLIVCTKNGGRLLTKKKAPSRPVEIPEELWRYVLMCRTKITRERHTGSSEDYWRRWLAERDTKKILGWNVSKKIRDLVSERITKVEVENERLRQQNEALAEAKKILDAAGVRSYSSWSLRHDLEKRLAAQAAAELPEEWTREFDSLLRSLTDARTKWDRLSKRTGGEPEESA